MVVQIASIAPSALNQLCLLLKRMMGDLRLVQGGQPDNTRRVRAKVEQSQLQIVVEMGHEVPLQSSLDVLFAALTYTPTSGSWSLVLLRWLSTLAVVQIVCHVKGAPECNSFSCFVENSPIVVLCLGVDKPTRHHTLNILSVCFGAFIASNDIIGGSVNTPSW